MCKLTKFEVIKVIKKKFEIKDFSDFFLFLRMKANILMTWIVL